MEQTIRTAATERFAVSQKVLIELASSIKSSCLNTGTSKQPNFGRESSFLKTTSGQQASFEQLLGIDVGGTHIKVSIQKNQQGVITTLALFDIPNDELKTGGSAIGGEDKSLLRMTTALAQKIRAQLEVRNETLHFDAIGVVWSNKIDCYELSGTQKGVGGKVKGIGSGTAYRKGEWWNLDLKDGDDISEAFLMGLKRNGLSCSAFVVNNDTVLTCKALPGAHGGVVSSTGANATLIPLSSEYLFNSECGGAINIPSEYFGVEKNELTGIVAHDFKIEDLTAGKGMPRVFKACLVKAIAQDSRLTSLWPAFEQEAFSARDLESIARMKVEKGFEGVQNELPFLSALAQQVIDNAGFLCSLLVFVSLANQVVHSGERNAKAFAPPEKEFLIALDSSQARHMPGYMQALERGLAALESAYHFKAKVQLLAPAEGVSVPLQGALQSVRGYI